MKHWQEIMNNEGEYIAEWFIKGIDEKSKTNINCKEQIGLSDNPILTINKPTCEYCEELSVKLRYWPERLRIWDFLVAGGGGNCPVGWERAGCEVVREEVTWLPLLAFTGHTLEKGGKKWTLHCKQQNNTEWGISIKKIWICLTII